MSESDANQPNLGHNFHSYSTIPSELFEGRTATNQPSPQTQTNQVRILDKIVAADGSKPPNAFSHDQYNILYERESRWNEVRKYSEFIRRFAGEASNIDMSKENFYDLYNMAVSLLKSVDSLDPDKMRRSEVIPIIYSRNQLNRWIHMFHQLLI